MTATTTRKPKATAHDPNAASADLLARIAAIVADRNGQEIDLLADFARAVESGTLTADGVKATLKAAEAAGNRLSYFRPTHAEYVVTMFHLSQLVGAPRSFDELYTLADRLTRIQVKEKGSSKASKARNVAADLAAKGAEFGKAKSATDSKWKKAQAGKKATGTARPDKGDKAKPESGSAVTVDMVNALRDAVKALPLEALTADLQAALLTLADTIHDTLDELAAE